MLTINEMVNFENGTLLQFFFLLLPLTLSLQDPDKSLLSICFALFLANNAYKSFRRAKCVALLVLYSRKLFLITLPLLFKKWVG